MKPYLLQINQVLVYISLIDYYIINIYFHAFTNGIMENEVPGPLIGNTNILQSKQHY